MRLWELASLLFELRQEWRRRVRQQQESLLESLLLLR